ncbi:MAG TPA: hypothetical protein VM689_13955 [Aliidongia sp.]|nr:hypothetical protein [Aliidongia sp.]
MSPGSGGIGGYNPDEPRDERGRWTTGGGTPRAAEWRRKPIYDGSSRGRATALATHAYLALPGDLRRRFGLGDSDTIDLLDRLIREGAPDSDSRQTASPAHYQLRAAASAAAVAETAGEMAQAGDHLASAVKVVGVGAWPRFIRSTALRKIIPISESGDEVNTPPKNEQPVPDDLELDPNWLKLPPGDRIDELGDLIEWIANAKPEDEGPIRAEIKRLYSEVGDRNGALMLNEALTQALRPGTTREDREEILRDYEHYARYDPADFGLLDDLLAHAALEKTLARILEAGEAVPGHGNHPLDDAWELGWGKRGEIIEKRLGKNLPQFFPTIDRFTPDGIATSIKSLDLRGASYQNPQRLLQRITTYLKSVAEFEGASFGDRPIRAQEIRGRELCLAVPNISPTAAQKVAFARALEIAVQLNVKFTLIRF